MDGDLNVQTKSCAAQVASFGSVLGMFQLICIYILLFSCILPNHFLFFWHPTILFLFCLLLKYFFLLFSIQPPFWRGCFYKIYLSNSVLVWHVTQALILFSPDMISIFEKFGYPTTGQRLILVHIGSSADDILKLKAVCELAEEYQAVVVACDPHGIIMMRNIIGWVCAYILASLTNKITNFHIVIYINVRVYLYKNNLISCTPNQSFCWLVIFLVSY